MLPPESIPIIYSIAIMPANNRPILSMRTNPRVLVKKSRRKSAICMPKLIQDSEKTKTRRACHNAVLCKPPTIMRTKVIRPESPRLMHAQFLILTPVLVLVLDRKDESNPLLWLCSRNIYWLSLRMAI